MPDRRGGPSLTAREHQVVLLLADGMRDEGVAKALSISPLTVRSHVENVMVKLGAATRTEAVATALRRHLIS